MSVVILASHPYFKYAKPSVWQMPNGRWTVRWRDFLTMKQDAEFDTKQQATAFASTICRAPLVIDDDYLEEDVIADAHEFWRTM